MTVNHDDAGQSEIHCEVCGEDMAVETNWLTECGRNDCPHFPHGTVGQDDLVTRAGFTQCDNGACPVTKLRWELIAALKEQQAFIEGADKIEYESPDGTIHRGVDFRKRAESAERVMEAAQWCLPLAKGYAAAHPVGSNAKYVAELETRLAAHDDATAKARPSPSPGMDRSLPNDSEVSHE